MTVNKKFKWKLPKSIANYANKYFEELIPKGDLKEAILMQSKVLKNTDTARILDNFLKDFLRNKKKKMRKI